MFLLEEPRPDGDAPVTPGDEETLLPTGDAVTLEMDSFLPTGDAVTLEMDSFEMDSFLLMGDAVTLGGVLVMLLFLFFLLADVGVEIILSP